jgi:hypothetical protein
MKITEKLAARKDANEPFFSLEFFPPKTDMVTLPLLHAMVALTSTGFGKPSTSSQSHGAL